MDIKPRRTPSVMAEGSDNGYRRPPLNSQLKSSGMITKLHGGDTWQVWKIQIFNLIQTAPNAEEILTGEIQESDPDYSLAIDIALGSLIGQTVQVDALGSLALSINGPKREKRGSALYAILRSPHERTDEATQRQMLGTLATLRQNGISLDFLFQLLNVTFSKAFSAGIELTEGMRRSYLMSSLDPRSKDKSGKSSVSKAKGGGESSSKTGGEKKPRSLPNDGKCFRCDQMGHLASAYPFPPATGSK
ncbi:unnamed protein product [Tilletia caries]|uniref:CCHC-type domain-containing protein n=1 Tax=Tilletia caries TaxID=13290 RepID=A0ABN7IYP0_9BASI|nr:unnamed protein product [Tilletia caries]